MTKTVLISICAAGLLASTSAQALTIDTNPTWDGSQIWYYVGSGQSLTIDAVENTLDTIGFYFHKDSAGHTFDFRISDAIEGGRDYFATSFNAVAGLNTFDVHSAFDPGSTVYAIFDFRGFGGSTVDYSWVNGYSGGHGFFLDQTHWNTGFPSIDLRFVASFSDADAAAIDAAVPLPATLPLVMTGLGLLAFWRRRSA